MGNANLAPASKDKKKTCKCPNFAAFKVALLLFSNINLSGYDTVAPLIFVCFVCFCKMVWTEGIKKFILRVFP